jgi:hypothetical protein
MTDQELDLIRGKIQAPAAAIQAAAEIGLAAALNMVAKPGLSN